MAGLINLRPPIRIPAPSGQEHPLFLEPYVADQDKKPGSISSRPAPALDDKDILHEYNPPKAFLKTLP